MSVCGGKKANQDRRYLHVILLLRHSTAPKMVRKPTASCFPLCLLMQQSSPKSCNAYPDRATEFDCFCCRVRIRLDFGPALRPLLITTYMYLILGPLLAIPYAVGYFTVASSLVVYHLIQREGWMTGCALSSFARPPRVQSLLSTADRSLPISHPGLKITSMNQNSQSLTS